MAKVSRRKAREDAVIILYQSDLLCKSAAKVLEKEIEFGKVLDNFTKEIVLGVSENLEIIDKRIKKVVENWSLDRIAIIDRNIIRVAIYEMFYKDEIPLKVSVDEAIEIAKVLGQKEDTPKFVNGILGKILLDIQDSKKIKNYN
ncbi:MAG: transcription antitermination factor NusB [Actinobacteria bacterium]|nr:transcription antitermination factor NusB [Actinomycetota bacterium]